MSLSDTEYQRIVEELKQSKSHLPDRQHDWLHRLMRMNAVDYAGFIGSILAYKANGHRALDGPFVDAMARAKAVSKRIRELSIWQVTEELMDVAERNFKRLEGMSTPSPDDFDRAIAAIQAAVELAEQRPA